MMIAHLVAYFTCCILIVSGCHWFPSNEKKGSLPRNLNSTEISRKFFTACMENKTSHDEALANISNSFDWEMNIDYVVFDSVWFLNVNQWFCSTAGVGDTSSCWQKQLLTFINKDSLIYKHGMACIAEYATNTTGSLSPVRYVSSAKIQVKSSLRTSESVYSSCVRENSQLNEQRKELNVDKLQNFIKETVYGCEIYDACSKAPELVLSDDTYQWPYKILVLSKADSPLRKAITICNSLFFSRKPFWSSWSTWSPRCLPCVTQQTQVLQTRQRSCLFGSTLNVEVNSARCGEFAIEKKPCNLQQCGPPSWSQWQHWSPDCPSCGYQRAVRTRIRECRSPFTTKVNTTLCPGLPAQVQRCRRGPCWNLWGPWSLCPPCGENIQQLRRRSCRNLFATCRGSHYETRECDVEPCAFDCRSPNCYITAWGAWTTWSICNESCQRTRHRTCHQVGRCQGSAVENLHCTGGRCSSRVTMFSPRWSAWSHWGPCSCAWAVPSRSRVRRCLTTFRLAIASRTCQLLYDGSFRETQHCVSDQSGCEFNRG